MRRRQSVNVVDEESAARGGETERRGGGGAKSPMRLLREKEQFKPTGWGRTQVAASKGDVVEKHLRA